MLRKKGKTHPTLRVSYDELIMMAEEWKHSTMDIDTWKNHEAFGNSNYTFRFDLVKFNQWLRSIPQNTTYPTQPSTTPRIIYLKHGNNQIYRAFDHKVKQVLISAKAIKTNEECAEANKLNLTDFYEPKPRP